jgi:hypothetical protein
MTNNNRKKVWCENYNVKYIKHKLEVYKEYEICILQINERQAKQENLCVIAGRVRR